MPDNQSAKSAKQFKDVPCPFCSLLCDDLVIAKQGRQLSVKQNGCKKAIQQYQNSRDPISARISGNDVEIDDAILKATNILKKSKRPLIAGLGTDVTGMRSIMELAEKTGGFLDHMTGAGLTRNMHVLQDRGWMLTTLTEVKNRADLVIFAGTDAGSYQRFFERLIWNDTTLSNLKPHSRNIVYIGEQLNTKAGISPSDKRPKVIKCSQEDIGEVFGGLRALLSNRPMTSESFAGVKTKQLKQLATLIENAEYGVIVWAPGELDYPHAELTIQTINEFIKERNQTSRFAGLSLGGNDGGISASNVCAWQAGYPLRTSFAKGYPEYDPENFSADKLIESNNVDSIVWISSYGSTTTPPNTNLPTVVIADPHSSLATEPDVFIPVGTVGIDHSGQLIRTDSVVSITMPQLCDSGLSSVKTIVNQITEKL